MAGPLFPNVPDLPGVPPVLRAPIGAASQAISAIGGISDQASDALSILGGAFPLSAVSTFMGISGSIPDATSAVNMLSGNVAAITSTLNGMAGSASAGIAALGSGDIGGAINAAMSIEDSASSAISAVQGLLSGDTSLLTADSANLTDDTAPQWGIFDSGDTLAIQPDSIVAVDYSKDEAIATYPVEKGGFESYNKVERPYDVRLTMTRGGSTDERLAFLSLCETLRGSTDLYSVVTPEAVYTSANVVRVGLVRNAERGAQLLTVEMGIEEVRETATAQFSASKSVTKDPASAAPVNGGQVQTKAPTAAQTPAKAPA